MEELKKPFDGEGRGRWAAGGEGGGGGGRWEGGRREEEEASFDDDDDNPMRPGRGMTAAEFFQHRGFNGDGEGERLRGLTPPSLPPSRSPSLASPLPSSPPPSS